VLYMGSVMVLGSLDLFEVIFSVVHDGVMREIIDEVRESHKFILLIKF